ncbi:hypothetical protein [Winogradskyella sp. 3972H.M.0a.05]|uniref:hypothetical protein n=1 Tax=Winogradskyella sp. 3972H.M.0a.05 TaxID=2950277 RepID=UPI0033959CF7
MKRYLLIMLLSFCCAISAQQGTSLTDKQKAKQEEEIEKRKAKYVDDLIAELNIDEFQQHIVKQKLYDYFDEKLKILQINQPYFKREQQIQDLDATYFEDLNGVIPDEAIAKMKKRLKGEDEEDSKKKKKKKKRKKKSKDN